MDWAPATPCARSHAAASRLRMPWWQKKTTCSAFSRRCKFAGISPRGISTEPAMRAVSYSHCSRTSTKSTLGSRARRSCTSRGVISIFAMGSELISIQSPQVRRKRVLLRLVFRREPGRAASNTRRDRWFARSNARANPQNLRGGESVHDTRRKKRDRGHSNPERAKDARRRVRARRLRLEILRSKYDSGRKQLCRARQFLRLLQLLCVRRVLHPRRLRGCPRYGRCPARRSAAHAGWRRLDAARAPLL